MNRLEFGDFHKFLASLGAFLIISSVAVPWLLLREPFDLTLPVSQLRTLTPEAQSVITDRQATVSFLVKIIRVVSPSLFLLACIFLIWGLVGWRRRQALYDEKVRLENEKLSREIRNMTPTEIHERALSESQEVEEELEPHELLEGTTSTRAQRYIQRERALVGLFSKCLAKRYKPREYVRIGPVEFDLVMRARNEADRDLIIEFKFVSKGFRYGWLRETSLKLIYMTEVYEDRVRSESAALLVIVAPAELLSRTPREQYTKRVASESERLGRRVRLGFIAEEGLSSLSCTDVETIATSDL